MTEHLIVLPERDTAEEIADELREEGFTEVRVVRMELAGEDDAESAEWGVHVVEEMVEDETGAVAKGLRERFEALAEEHDGWYDDDPSL
jgi:precorrin-6B methylase 1